jgi:2,3,4,5-tetrahydropyridine-2-carboxylate N-succinyltransferase
MDLYIKWCYYAKLCEYWCYVDAGTMVDTWATVGSCAQIGKDVHLSGGVVLVVFRTITSCSVIMKTAPLLVSVVSLLKEFTCEEAVLGLMYVDCFN